MIVDDVWVQVISAARPEWIAPFTKLQPAQFRKLVQLVVHGEATPSLTGDRVGLGR